MSKLHKTEPKGVLEAAAEWVDIESLTPWSDNPRNNKAAVQSVAASIKRFGFASPIIARTENREVIAGHTRLLAAQSLGLDTVPVRFMDLDPADAKLLALADNKVGEIADWDNDKLEEIFLSLREEEIDLDGLGWSEKDIDALLGELPEEIDDGYEVSEELSFSVVVTCKDEIHQSDLLNQFESEGLTCQPLIS